MAKEKRAKKKRVKKKKAPRKEYPGPKTRPPEEIRAEIAIITIAFDRTSGKMFYSFSGWDSVKETDDVLNSFQLQMLRPALIQEEAANMVRLQKELKDSKHNE